VDGGFLGVLFLGLAFFWLFAGLSLVTTALKVSVAKLALGKAAMSKIPTHPLHMLWAVARKAGVSHLLVAFIKFSLPFFCVLHHRPMGWVCKRQTRGRGGAVTMRA
jgi:hypothetical protein